MIEWASRAQIPCSGSTGAPGRSRFFATPRLPYSESSAGWSVTAPRTETIGIRKPATPIIRMNGSGIASSSASPSATAAPEKTTARPAVCIVRTTASSRSRPRASSSRKR